MAVGEDDGEQLVLIVEKVAAVEVSDGNLTLVPLEIAAGNNNMTVIINNTNLIYFLCEQEPHYKDEGKISMILFYKLAILLFIG